MKRKFLCLLLALVLAVSMIPAAMAATDSKGRYALNNNDYVHAYVVKGDILDAEFRYDTVDAPCASPVWLFEASLTGKETQAELDALAYDLLTSGKKPLYHDEGWTHSLNTNRQSQLIETAELKLGTYLIVAAAMSDYRFCCDGDTKVHYETATGVGLHVVEKAVPIETYEYWYCDADGSEVKQLSAEEVFIISHENDSPLYRFKIKTYPENATERVIELRSSASAENADASTPAIPGFTFEDGMYRTCAQCCGRSYFWLVVDSFGEAEGKYDICHNNAFEVPCHPSGPVKVREWYTCTEPGYKAAYCYGYGSTCDTVYGYEIMDPPGHTLKEVYEIITEPTATRAGLGTGLCKNCLSRGVEGHIPAIFSDVKPDLFYSDALDYGYAAGWVNGLTANTFGPAAACNRAQIVTFLWRAAGCPEPEAAEHPFTDVEAGSFYEKAVLWAVENGITTGTSAATFSPDKTCSRAEVVTFLWRANGSPDTNAENPFADVTEADFFCKAVLWAVENGITNGLDADHFGPYSICNRAQVVTFLYRAKDLPKADPAQVYTFTLTTNDPTEEIGYAFCEETAFEAGERVIFTAVPWYGYLVEFSAEPAGEALELYYLGADVYELVMPAHDVTLTAHFVPAEGTAHYITTTCTNGFALADCDVDDDFNDFAKPGELVVFYIVPDEGFDFSESGFTATVNGEIWEDVWYLGEIVEEDPEVGTVDGIFLVEMRMPDADVSVTVTCTAEADSTAADIRVPVALR